MLDQLPDPKNFDTENSFYLSASPRRISKFIAHYELYKKCLGISGALVECGVFKGVSLARWAKFRDLFTGQDVQQIVAFDTFDEFPEADYAGDVKRRSKFVQDAGSRSISVEQMEQVLKWHNLDRKVVLVPGDILKTIPDYIQSNPELRIAFLHIDVDLYGPTKAALEHLYPLVVHGGVIVLDDYAVFPGATKAIDEYFATPPPHRPLIQRFDFAPTPSFFVKK